MEQSVLDPKTQEAIKSALDNDWPKAIQLNQELAARYPKDIDTMNRLARAYMETGEIAKAKKLYHQVLEIDPYNPIATKNIPRLATIKVGAKSSPSPNNDRVRADIFLEEPGRTAIANLIDTALPGILAELRTGDRLELKQNKTSITLISNSGHRIGQLDESLGKLLEENFKIGSQFEAFIKSVSFKEKTKPPQVEIFIRETQRSPKASTTPFPVDSSSFTPYIREEAMKLLANQAPVQTETDDGVEEVEVSTLPSAKQEESFEDLVEKEAEESEHLDENG
jgi:hypothetical protein